MRLIRGSMLPLLTLVLAAPLGAANRQAIGTALDKAYQNQDMAQRIFHSGVKVEYAADGSVIHGGKPGAWTLDAEIQCGKVRLKRRNLVITGKRLYFIYDKNQKRLRPYLGPKVEIDIATGESPPSLSTLQREIAEVFVTGGDNSMLLVPDYWKDYLLHPDVQGSAPKQKMSAVPKSAIKGKQAGGSQEQSQPVSMAMTAGPAGSDTKKGKVTPPKVTYKIEPPYTREARMAGVQGTVILAVIVDDKGRVTSERIIRPLGMGLDDDAAHTVQTWRFKPATRGGKAVPVYVIIKVSFQLSG
ncbi:MAG TPA: energy transducer TonB [Terriglobia bacterium]|nr:energy transducer TonB [Terriglobia bacterium]